MENQTKVEDQKAPQIGQYRKVNYWMVSTFLLLIILLTSGVWFVLNIKNRIFSDQQPAVPDQTNETVVTGVLRTSGLSEEEKQQFALTTAAYQITDFGDYQKTSQQGQTMGYYLLSTTITDELLGKCVRVAGMIPLEWKSKNKSDSYNRLALNIANIEKIDNASCNPYSQTPPTIDNTQEKLVLRGTIVHGKRPAPDIGYDYQLKLVEPFIDKFSSVGATQEVSEVYIAPTTNSLWTELENNIDKEVTVEGYMAWGYAESRYLEIISIKGLTNNDEAAVISPGP